MGSMPRIEDFKDASFNPFTATKELGGEGRIKDFFPELKRLRDLNPVSDGELKQHFGLGPHIGIGQHQIRLIPRVNRRVS